MKVEATYAKKIIHQVLGALGREGREISALFEANTPDTLKAIAFRAMPDVTDPDFPRAYAAWSLLRKSVLLAHGTDTAEMAKIAFQQTEYDCHLINNHNGTRATDRISKSIGEAMIHIAQEKIARVLAEFDLDEYFDAVSHSGGASTQRQRDTSSIKNKWGDTLDVTAEAADILHSFMCTSPHTHKVYRLVEGALAFTVPKDAKTDRLIFKEPQGNMFLQKGIGAMIRRRLRREGIDLNDQGLNQRLASRLDIATVDLSNASNRISRQTVALLLQKACPKWYFMLDSTRCKSVSFKSDDSFQVLEMFSGMGNGFTFELESLLFYGLAHAADALERDINRLQGERVVSIYGDDIIVRSEVYDTLTVGLQYCGFEVNVLKSYATGPFRESCGEHYWFAANCTPVYLKDRHFDRLEDMFYLRNTIAELNERLQLSQLHEVCNRIDKYLRKKDLFWYVPQTYSKEAGIRASFDVARPKCERRPKRAKKPFVQGYVTYAWAPELLTYRVCEYGSYLRALRRHRHQPDVSRLRLRVFALLTAITEVDDVAPIYKEYRKGTDAYAVTQGEKYTNGTYTRKRVVIPSGMWT